MMDFIIIYLITATTLFVLDAVWLGVVAKPFFQKHLGYLMAENIKMGVAALFYVAYAVGIVVFAIQPALANDNVWDAVLYGALFGFLAYGTYDFTNWAVIKDWPPIVTLVDVSWGTFVTSISAVIGYYGFLLING